MRQPSYKGYVPLPDAIIDAACAGDAEAIDRVLRNYDGYINKLCIRKVIGSDRRTHYVVDEYMKRGCRFSGGEMTGKFRKVASHYAPEPAFGLFLNLPEGTSPLCSGPHRANVHWTLCAPLEPRHVNGVSIPAKCPPDIPSEDLLID